MVPRIYRKTRKSQPKIYHTQRRTSKLKRLKKNSEDIHSKKTTPTINLDTCFSRYQRTPPNKNKTQLHSIL